jgi:hypothetical protein
VGWPFKSLETGIRRFLSLILLFLLFEIVEVVILLIIHQPIHPFKLSTLCGAFVPSLAIYVISWCHKYTIEQLEAVFMLAPPSQNVQHRLIVWLKNSVNLWAQLFTSIIATVVVILALYIIKDKVGLPFKTNVPTYTFIVAGIVTFCMGQGAYWALVSPFVTKALRNVDISDIQAYPLNPSKTPLIVALSRILSVYAIWDAIMVTLCLIGLFALRPDFSSGGIFYVLALVFMGYLVTSWTYFYPRYNLTKIVQHTKESTLLRIQNEIKKLYGTLDKLEKINFERLQNLMELHETVSKVPSTIVSLPGLQSFIGSLMTPTVIAIVGLLDWKSILQDIIAIFK